MARPVRPLAPDLTYHVTSRGVHRRNVVADDEDAGCFSRLLGETVVERGWRLLTWCLMPNHVHLVLRTPDANLSVGLRDVLGTYARRYNDRHERVGHLFAARYHARLVIRDAHQLELYRYVALNPVRAGLVDGAEVWAWSAHRALMGAAAAPAWLAREEALDSFGADPSRYVAFVTRGDPSASLLSRLVGSGQPDELRGALDAGFSQREIADELGMTQSSVSRRLGRPTRSRTPEGMKGA